MEENDTVKIRIKELQTENLQADSWLFSTFYTKEPLYKCIGAIYRKSQIRLSGFFMYPRILVDGRRCIGKVEEKQSYES